jgi:hypothetical protein
MNGYDLGTLLVAIRATLPTKRLAEFDEIIYRGAMSAEASDALRFALGVDRANEQLRKFQVINGGIA